MCSREPEHEGPCAAVPERKVGMVEIRMLMSRELVEQLAADWSAPMQLRIEQERDGFWSMLAREPEGSSGER